MSPLRDVKLVKSTVEIRSRTATMSAELSDFENSGVLRAVLKTFTHDCRRVDSDSFSCVSTFKTVLSSLSATRSTALKNAPGLVCTDISFNGISDGERIKQKSTNFTS